MTVKIDLSEIFKLQIYHETTAGKKVSVLDEIQHDGEVAFRILHPKPSYARLWTDLIENHA